MAIRLSNSRIPTSSIRTASIRISRSITMLPSMPLTTQRLTARRAGSGTACAAA
jgi:hypothetical protein